MRIIGLLLLLFSLNGSAQVFSVARYCGMGNTGVALQGLASLTANAAGLAVLTTPMAGVYYQEHALNTDIRTQGALIAVPSKLGVFGAHLSNYGIRRAYGELKAGITYAKDFGGHFFSALTVNYHQLRINNYGGSQTYSVDVGLQYRIRTNWIVGARLANPGYASYDYSVYAVIPVQFSLGTSYKLHDDLLLTSDLERVLYRKKTDFRTGLEYKPSQLISLRGGLGVNEFTQFCGFGLYYQKMILDLAAVIHPRLGVAPQLFLAYAF